MIVMCIYIYISSDVFYTSCRNSTYVPLRFETRRSRPVGSTCHLSEECATGKAMEDVWKTCGKAMEKQGFKGNPMEFQSQMP